MVYSNTKMSGKQIWDIQMDIRTRVKLNAPKSNSGGIQSQNN